MTDTLFALVSNYGLWVVAASVFLSCIALPIPASVLMLGAGAFAASGDFMLWQVLAVSWIAAMIGDQTGFQIGRAGGATLIARLQNRPSRARVIARARATVLRHGGIGVFLSRWLFSPLGPYVNLIAGAADLPRKRFTLWGALGEAVWVALYVGLGYAFAGRLDALIPIVVDWSGLVLALGLGLGAAVLLVQRVRRRYPVRVRSRRSR
ncbi:MAG: membrane-associated protein DedA [Roseibaca calidilacus]|uniref:Membrane protein DedA, SNARE-associated domain n=1 Tax=Roseibaca calidilacus TaxID=1666912 RepID=A0A0P7W8R8_9RHOB|nr:VTT domain-containing protein [Roseibaca calidilacus]KPP93578.1 MAG: membrane-associated protein DedA [Roseibaca calidilacus]CUX80417.1 membrane protein DedA, SNARE-associated domain [Roseibaca calidilacus]